MLSILIPTYNYNVYPLVLQIHKQALKANVNFEIICFDDGSFSFRNEENKKINELSFSTFYVNSKNVGLSSNRNLLIEASKYEYVIFIDGDSVIINDNYISNYLDAISTEIEVIYGGRIHPHSIKNVEQMLRWKYGKYVEDKSALVRRKATYKTLMFNNTLVKKKLFKALKFDASLTKYGHEDTLLAYQMSLKKIGVKHIDNPILHGDIDSNSVFINKTSLGIENLKSLYCNGLISKDFIKLLFYFEKFKRFKLNLLLILFYKFSRRLMIKNLESNNPSLFVFNLFKLSYFCQHNSKY